MEYNEGYTRGVVRSIYFSNGVKKSTVMPMYSWEKELGLVSLFKNPSFASMVRPSNMLGRKKTPFTFISDLVCDYCQNTSLHGFKYIVDDTNFLIEKIAWFIVCCSAIAGTFMFLQPIFKLYFAREFLTTIKSVGQPIWEVPFPAVTICNVNKAAKNLIVEAAKTPPWNNYSEDTVREVIDFMALFGQIPVDKPHEVRDDIIKCADEQDKHIDSLMKAVIQPLDRMILKCWWVGVSSKCSDLFKIKRTDEGYCWGFNSASMKDSDSGESNTDHDDELLYRDHGQSSLLKAGESSKKLTTDDSINDFEEMDWETSAAHAHKTSVKKKKVKPTDFVAKKVNGAGPNMGLTVLLNPDVPEYQCNTNNVHGFKVLIHDPDEFPSIAIKAFLANAGREIFVPVTPTKTSSDNNIEKIPEEQRQCRFDHEIDLKFHHTFTFDNCFLQCQVMSMNKTCGCVPYVYSKLKGVNVCDFLGMSCINNNTAKFSSLSPHDGAERPGLDKTVGTMENCYCPHNCEEVVYIPEVSTATFPKYPDDMSIDINVTKTKLTLMRVYFKELSFVEYNNNLVYTVEDLISAFGGIVSLFIGFSFVSAAEFMYFFTIRPVLHFSRSVSQNDSQNNN